MVELQETLFLLRITLAFGVVGPARHLQDVLSLLQCLKKGFGVLAVEVIDQETDIEHQLVILLHQTLGIEHNDIELLDNVLDIEFYVLECLCTGRESLFRQSRDILFVFSTKLSTVLALERVETLL